MKNLEEHLSPVGLKHWKINPSLYETMPTGKAGTNSFIRGWSLATESPGGGLRRYGTNFDPKDKMYRGFKS